METITTVRKMLSEMRCITSSNNRSYRWNTPKLVKDKETHTDLFWNDIKNLTKEKKYYFGHFIFEKEADFGYSVLDGLQRLITVSVFVSALFENLKKFRPYKSLNKNEKDCFDDMVKIPSNIVTIETLKTLKTNEYLKNLVFEVCDTIDQETKIKSIKRIIKAFEYFIKILSVKNESELMLLLNIISEAPCTTYCLEISVDYELKHQIYQAINYRGKRLPNDYKEDPFIMF